MAELLPSAAFLVPPRLPAPPHGQCSTRSSSFPPCTHAHSRLPHPHGWVRSRCLQGEGGCLRGAAWCDAQACAHACAYARVSHALGALQLDAAEESKGEQARLHDHLESQVKKAEETLKRERAALDTELAACTAELATVNADMEAVQGSLGATTASVKDLEPGVLAHMIEE